jgi:hypothetical protein
MLEAIYGFNLLIALFLLGFVAGMAADYFRRRAVVDQMQAHIDFLITKAAQPPPAALPTVLGMDLSTISEMVRYFQLKYRAPLVLTADFVRSKIEELP